MPGDDWYPQTCSPHGPLPAEEGWVMANVFIFVSHRGVHHPPLKILINPSELHRLLR